MRPRMKQYAALCYHAASAFQRSHASAPRQTQHKRTPNITRQPASAAVRRSRATPRATGDRRAQNAMFIFFTKTSRWFSNAWSRVERSRRDVLPTVRTQTISQCCYARWLLEKQRRRQGRFEQICQGELQCRCLDRRRFRIGRAV